MPDATMADAGAKKGKTPKAKKPKTAPTHPKVSEMVTEAISNLNERGGSSLQAIKKYIAANYKVDVEKLSSFIKKYLKTSVVSGGLVQTKGKGATGSFRISGASGAKEKSASKPKKAATKAAKPKKTTAATPKKAAKPKKAAEKKKPQKATPVKKAKPAAKSTPKKKAVKLVTKQKKAKATPKKAAAKKGKK